MFTTELLLILATLFQSMMPLEMFSIDEGSWKTKNLQGRFTRDVKEYEVTVPSKLSSEGKFLSYYLPHFYKRDLQKVRERRSADYTNDTVHYGLAIGEQEYIVELYPNRGLMSPGLMVEKRSGGSLQDTDIHPASPEQCHYTGWIRGNRNTTRAAISVCHSGMVGYVKTSDGRRHFIEPVSDHLPESDGRHLHMVYENPQDTRHKRNCGTGDDWETAWRERLMREGRRHAGPESSLKRDVEKRLQRVRDAVRHPEEKRTVLSEHRYLEIFVVADKRFIEYHNTPDRENYILTIMNMANDFYHDESVGNLIDFVVVRIMYLEKEEEEMDLIINRDAEATLASFCKWQFKVNPTDISHPNHHDIAVLLTRYDICSDNVTECGLLGLANTAQACETTHSCCINEDNGLTLGVVVTHEVGHVLGCAHDEPEFSGCEPYSDPEKHFGHVMSPYVQLATNKWSTCSKGFITEFVESDMGSCLLDEPQEHSFILPNMPPGAMYDIDWQCRQKFGPNSKSCKRTPKETCEKLWCTMGDKDQCGTYGSPPADGTKCGENMWCFERHCVDIGARPSAVDGGWAEWGPYTACSRTCGGGVSVSERDCTNPAPKNHGRYCTGEKKRYRICNTTPCNTNEPGYRASQCAEYDSKPFKDKLYHWTPYKGEMETPCKLICCNEANECRVLSPRAADGTPCKPGTRDMCIAGRCRKVGCDWVVDSSAVEDQCGICNGDGTGCKIVESTFTLQGGNDYEKIVTIPAEARKIFVEEVQPSANTIAVADETGTKFYLNGDYSEEIDGERRIAGSVSIYTHPEPDKEMLAINGPLENSINLYVCFFEDSNPGVTYKYALPIKSEKALGAEGPVIMDVDIPVSTTAAPEPDIDSQTESTEGSLDIEIPIMTSAPPSVINNQPNDSNDTMEIPMFGSSLPDSDEKFTTSVFPETDGGVSALPDSDEMFTSMSPETAGGVSALPDSDEMFTSMSPDMTGGVEFTSVSPETAGGVEFTSMFPETAGRIEITPMSSETAGGFELGGTTPASVSNIQLNSQNTENEGHENKYSWEFLEWGECSAKCGGGVQMSDPYCVEERSGRVSDSYCKHLTKPEPMARICNSEPCKAHWKIGAWSPCQGCLYQRGCRMRSVNCVKQSPAQDLEVITDDKDCQGKKPATSELCTPVKVCHHNASQAHDTSHKNNTEETTAKPPVTATMLKGSKLSGKSAVNKHVKERNVLYITVHLGSNGNLNNYDVKDSRKLTEDSKIINNNHEAISSYRPTSNYNPKSPLAEVRPQQKEDGIVALSKEASVGNDQSYAQNENSITKNHRTILNVAPQHVSEEYIPNVKVQWDADLAAYRWMLFHKPQDSLSRQNSRGTDYQQQKLAMDNLFRANGIQSLHANSMTKKRYYRKTKSNLPKNESKNDYMSRRRRLKRHMSRRCKENTSKKSMISADKEKVPRPLKKLHIGKRKCMINVFNTEAYLKGSRATQNIGRENKECIVPHTKFQKPKSRLNSKKRNVNKRHLQRYREKLKSPFANKRACTPHGNNTYPNKKDNDIVDKEAPKVTINKADIGKFVKDRVPQQDFQLEEAPMIEETKNIVLSDEASEMLGDMVPDIINTKNATYLKGKQTEEVQKHLIHAENGGKQKQKEKKTS